MTSGDVIKKADEKGNAGTGAEGGDGAEGGPQKVAGAPAFSGKEVADSVAGERSAQPADGIDGQNQQQKDLERVVNEEFKRAAQRRFQR